MSLDRRLRDELRREADAIEPDVERHLGAVEARARRRGGIGASTLLLAAAIVVAAIILRVPDPRFGGEAGSSGPPTPVASSSASPSPSRTAPATYPEIAGTYLATLDAADAAVKRDALGGEWTMRLQPEGVVFLSPPASFVPGASGLSGIAFSLVGDRFRTNLFYNDYCNSIGTYAWSRAGNTLTFTQVDETCSIRRSLLATTPWVIGP
jgi:hypothetical protein